MTVIDPEVGSTDSMWASLKMGRKVVEILDVRSHAPGHHFGRPFMSLYQIAIEFKNRYPNEFEALGLPVGGRGAGRRNSLAQYIGRMLSSFIRKYGSAYPVEGCFVSRHHVATLQYKDGDDVIESSLGDTWDSTVFRLRD